MNLALFVVVIAIVVCASVLAGAVIISNAIYDHAAATLLDEFGKAKGTGDDDGCV